MSSGPGVKRNFRNALGRVTDQSLRLGEGDVGGGSTVSLVVGDDLNSVVLPNTDTIPGQTKNRVSPLSCTNQE